MSLIKRGIHAFLEAVAAKLSLFAEWGCETFLNIAKNTRSDLVKFVSLLLFKGFSKIFNLSAQFYYLIVRLNPFLLSLSDDAKNLDEIKMKRLFNLIKFNFISYCHSRFEKLREITNAIR